MLLCLTVEVLMELWIMDVAQDVAARLTNF
jgi:hypothetical protein